MMAAIAKIQLGYGYIYVTTRDPQKRLPLQFRGAILGDPVLMVQARLSHDSLSLKG